jgi:hypothetical protein
MAALMDSSYVVGTFGEISEISIAVESDSSLSNVKYTCIQQGPLLRFVNYMILVFDLTEDNDVCEYRSRRGSDVILGQASNTKGRSCPMLSSTSRTY